MDGWVLFRLSANFVFVLPVGVKIYFLYLWRRNSNEELWEMGNAKQCNLKELVTVTQLHGRQKMSVIVRYTAESQAAVNENGRQTEPLQITVIWLSKSVIGGRRIFLTKMHTTDGKGICRSSWRKWMRCPRRLRVPSLNKIAQTAVRPSPLWEFRAANCFRDLIATLQNENPRRTAVV